MEIRAANRQDAAAISQLICPLASKFIAHEFTEVGEQNLLEAMSPKAIAGFLDAGYRYHVAESNGELVGVVATRDNRHLFHLFVAEPHQGRGFARSLWDVARQACTQAGNTDAFTVNSSRYAIRFYRKLGFVESGPSQVTNGVLYFPMRRPAGGMSEPPADCDSALGTDVAAGLEVPPADGRNGVR